MRTWQLTTRPLAKTAPLLVGVALLAGTWRPTPCVGASGDTSWGLNLTAQCPPAHVEYDYRGGFVALLDLNSFLTIAGTVQQSADGSLSMQTGVTTNPDGSTTSGTLTGTVSGKSIKLQWDWGTSSTGGIPPYLSSHGYGVSATYSGSIAGNSMTGTVYATYSETTTVNDPIIGQRQEGGSGETWGTFSANASDIIPRPPGIEAQPQGGTVAQGQTFAFHVVADGTEPLGYQWFKGGALLRDGGTLWGAQTSSLTLTNAHLADTGDYTVVVSNSYWALTSEVATLTVEDPFIATQPVDQTVNSGDTASFNVVAVGTPPLSYQWFKDGVSLSDAGDVSGAQSPTLTFRNVNEGDLGRYWVVVSNVVGTATNSLTVLRSALETNYQVWTIDGTITVSGYIGPTGAAVIPSKIDGLPVTGIFLGGVGACFRNGDRITSMSIPTSVTNITAPGFGCFPNLGAITVAPLNPAYSSADGVLFDKTQTSLILSPQAKVGGFRIPDSVVSVANMAFLECSGLTSITIPDSVTSIGDQAFQLCTSLASVDIPNSVTRIGWQAFAGCMSLTNVAIGSGVTSLCDAAFTSCVNLRSVTISDGVTTIGDAFSWCGKLTSVIIPNTVTDIGTNAFFYCGNLSKVTISSGVIDIRDYAFGGCRSLTNIVIPSSVQTFGVNPFADCFNLKGIYFQGNAPGLVGDGVLGITQGTVYYVPGTTGWGTTYSWMRTAPWPRPSIQSSPQTQTAEAGSAADLQVQASGPDQFCLWYFNETNLIGSGTIAELELTNVQFLQSGAYTAVITNAGGAVTSAPAMLEVITPVERRPILAVKVTGEAGSQANVDYADSLSPAPTWTALGSVNLTTTPQYCFDVTTPLPAQRFYRAWQTGVPALLPSLQSPYTVPGITLAGNIGDQLRVDYINQFGPIDAWVTQGTVTLTNTSQLYFDVSAPGQPPRLYRIVPVP